MAADFSSPVERVLGGGGGGGGGKGCLDPEHNGVQHGDIGVA